MHGDEITQEWVYTFRCFLVEQWRHIERWCVGILMSKEMNLSGVTWIFELYGFIPKKGGDIVVCQYGMSRVCHGWFNHPCHRAFYN